MSENENKKEESNATYAGLDGNRYFSVEAVEEANRLYKAKLAVPDNTSLKHLAKERLTVPDKSKVREKDRLMPEKRNIDK